MKKVILFSVALAVLALASLAGAEELKATKDKALLKIFVQNTAGIPVEGVVASVTSEKGVKLLSQVTDREGYMSILVPVGQAYLVKFISFGEEKKETARKIEIPAKEFYKFTVKMIYNPVLVPTFTLSGVYFDTDKANLKPECHSALADLLDFMMAKKSAVIELSGHTDDRGDDAKNLDLSQRRADAVKAYFVDKGIEADRIQAVGYGETRPVASNETTAGRQQNRRTEVRILNQ